MASEVKFAIEPLRKLVAAVVSVKVQSVLALPVMNSCTSPPLTVPARPRNAELVAVIDPAAFQMPERSREYFHSPPDVPESSTVYIVSMPGTAGLVSKNVKP